MTASEPSIRRETAHSETGASPSLRYERGVRAASSPRQAGEMGARDQRPRRLVEADMAVHPQSEDLQPDPARPLDGPFVSAAFALDVPCRFRPIKKSSRGMAVSAADVR